MTLMKAIKPDYVKLGFADQMGPKLRKLVEQQLQEDLKHYGVNQGTLKFDWSESCVEGHQTFWLDGAVENFSGIAVFDREDNFVAHGWMDFMVEEDSSFFVAYWDLVTTYEGNKVRVEKGDFGIPDHVWNQLPESLKPTWQGSRCKQRKLP